MSWVKDNVFGGAAKDAAREQQEAFRGAQDLTRQATNQARADINRIFPTAQDNLLRGMTGAIDVFNQVTPQQMQIAQQGNMAAQQALLAGLPQMNNAILGMPVDYSGIQAQQFATPQFNFQAPQFNQNYGQPAQQAQAQVQSQAQPQLDPNSAQAQQQAIQQILSGSLFGQGAGGSIGASGAGGRNVGDPLKFFMR